MQYIYIYMSYQQVRECSHYGQVGYGKVGGMGGSERTRDKRHQIEIRDMDRMKYVACGVEGYIYK